MAFRIRTTCAEFRIEFPPPIKEAASRRHRWLRDGRRIRPQDSGRLFGQEAVVGDHGRYMIISALGADYQRLRGDRNIRFIHRDGRTSRDIYLNSQPGPPGGALRGGGVSLSGFHPPEAL